MGEIKYRTLRESVVDAIREKIISHELEPGMRIIEQEISEEFGVSRGPIREAFRQLEQEGLVEYTRNMGCSVKEITLEDVFEAYLLRGTYELIAVKSFNGVIPDNALKEMRRILDLMENMKEDSFNDIINYDNLFHGVMVKETGMPRLIKAWNDLDYATILSCSVETQDSKTLAGWQYKVHNKLYDIYCSNDITAICEVIADHYMSSIKRRLASSNVPESDFKFPLDILETLVTR